MPDSLVLHFVTTLISVLTGATIAAGAATLNQWWTVRRDRQGLLNTVLAVLLDVRHRASCSFLLPGQLSTKLEEALNLDAQDVEDLLEMVLREMGTSTLGGMLADNDALQNEYSEAIAKLSAIDPVLAYRLRGSAQIGDMLESWWGVMSEGAMSTAEFRILREMRRTAASDAIRSLDDTIREVARRAGAQQVREVEERLSARLDVAPDLDRMMIRLPAIVSAGLAGRGRDLRAHQMRLEVPANVLGIKTCQLAFDAAFDEFVPVGSREEARREASVSPRKWSSSDGWSRLGWQPAGPVRGAYWVEVTEDGSDFTVFGICDVDGDGKFAEYRATRDGGLVRVSKPGVY